MTKEEILKLGFAKYKRQISAVNYLNWESCKNCTNCKGCEYCSGCVDCEDSTAGSPTGKKDQDYTAGTIIAVDPELRTVYVVDSWRGRLTLKTSSNMVIKEYAKYRPFRVSPAFYECDVSDGQK